MSRRSRVAIRRKLCLELDDKLTSENNSCGGGNNGNTQWRSSPFLHHGKYVCLPIASRRNSLWLWDLEELSKIRRFLWISTSTSVIHLKFPRRLNVAIGFIVKRGKSRVLKFKIFEFLKRRKRNLRTKPKNSSLPKKEKNKNFIVNLFRILNCSKVLEQFGGDHHRSFPPRWQKK